MHWTRFQRYCHLHSRQTSLSQNISFLNDASIVLGFWTTFLQPISICSTGTEWVVQRWFVSTIGTLLDSNGSNLPLRILFHYCCSNCWKVNIRFIYLGFNTFPLLHNVLKSMQEVFPDEVQQYLLDVLWGQPIKLIQVVSTSEFHEYWWNDADFIFFVPSI